MAGSERKTTRKAQAPPPKTAVAPADLGVATAVPQPMIHEGVPLLETADEYLMDTLCTDARLAPLILVRLSPTVAVVAPENLEKLSAALVKGGHLPKIIGPNDAP